MVIHTNDNAVMRTMPTNMPVSCEATSKFCSEYAELNQEFNGPISRFPK